MKTKLYLDIDGVLLGKETPDSIEIVLARHAREFLECCLKNFQCFWLTTHCKDQDVTNAIRWLRPYIDESITKLIKQIKPVSWNTLKTEGIDFASDFYWIDDEILMSEREVLIKNNVLHRYLRINTYKHSDDLKRAIDMLNDCIFREELFRNGCSLLPCGGGVTFEPLYAISKLKNKYGEEGIKQRCFKLLLDTPIKADYLEGVVEVAQGILYHWADEELLKELLRMSEGGGRCSENRSHWETLIAGICNKLRLPTPEGIMPLDVQEEHYLFRQENI